MSEENKTEENSAAQPESAEVSTNTQTESSNGAPFNIETVISDAKRVILDPVGFYRTMSTTGGLAEPVIFVAVMMFATMVIGFVFGFIGLAKFNPITGGSVGLSMLFVGPILGVVGSFIGAAIMFGIWKLMGSERDFETAYRCLAYTTAIAPIIAAISIIPYLANLLKALWSGFLLYTASTQVHSIKDQTAKMVIGALTALVVLIGYASEKATRYMNKNFGHIERAAEQFEKSYKDGSIGAAAKNLENIDEMTPEEAGKQLGEFLKGLEKFSEGLEESVNEDGEN